MTKEKNWAIITITKNGTALAVRFRTHFPHLQLFAKYPNGYPNCTPITGKLADQIPSWFAQFDALIFVMATGIVVRSIAPSLNHKSTDPAVLVVDEAGQYVISLLSGHLGGANALAKTMAEKIGAQAIITTATDTQGKDPIDLFAQQNQLQITNWPALTKLTALLVNGEKLHYSNKTKQAFQLPEHAPESEAAGIVYISKHPERHPTKPSVTLYAPSLMVGVGCRRGKTGAELIQFLTEEMEKLNLPLSAITRLVSIELKSDEQGIHELAQHLNLRPYFYSTAEVATVEHHFEGSDFVQRTLGVRCVSEPAAYLAGRGKGDFLVQKARKDGMTLSVFRVKFK